MFWSCEKGQIAYTPIMDGFNTIPIQNNPYQVNNSLKTPENPSVKIPIGNVNNPIQLDDDSGVKVEVKESSLFLILSIISLAVVFGYFAYLIFTRYMTLQEISALGIEFQTLSTSIDKNEIDEFIALDQSLKVVNQKLSRHPLLFNVLGFVNKNIRNNMQVTDYRVNLKDKEIEVTLLNISPSFKELAEQTEKMFELRSAGEIKSFFVSQLGLETDGRKVRFNLNIIFDRARVSANSKATPVLAQPIPDATQQLKTEN